MRPIMPNIEAPVEVIRADRDQLCRGLLSTGGWSVEIATANVAGLPDTDGALQMLARHRIESAEAATSQEGECICGGEYTMCADGHAINCPASNQRDAYRGMITATPTHPTNETEYKSAWEALSEPLSWMHDSAYLKSYWGWNLADIANDLIDKAYPGLRSNKTVGTAEGQA